MGMMGFLPWLKLRKEVKVGQTVFVPYLRGERPFGESTKEQQIADQIMCAYRPNMKRAVDCAAIVRFADRSLTDEVSEEDMAYVWSDAEILCLSAIAKNQYFVEIGPYVNASLFEVIFQRFGEKAHFTAMRSRRRDGGTREMSPMDLVNISPPPGTRSCLYFELAYDIDLAEALVRHRACDDWRRWADAIVCFLLANTDSDHVPLHNEMVLTLAAFQRVLGAGSKEGELASAFGKVLALMADLMTSQSRRLQGRPDAREEPLRVAWMRHFWKARGSYAHNKLSNGYRAPWRDEEFLLLGAFIFPVVVKRLLAAKGYCRIGDDDLLKEQAFEGLADCDIFGGVPWPWLEILEQARFQLLTKRAADLFTGHRGPSGDACTAEP